MKNNVPKITFSNAYKVSNGLRLFAVSVGYQKGKKNNLKVHLVAINPTLHSTHNPTNLHSIFKHNNARLLELIRGHAHTNTHTQVLSRQFEFFPLKGTRNNPNSTQQPPEMRTRAPIDSHFPDTKSASWKQNTNNNRSRAAHNQKGKQIPGRQNRPNPITVIRASFSFQPSSCLAPFPHLLSAVPTQPIQI